MIVDAGVKVYCGMRKPLAGGDGRITSCGYADLLAAKT